MSERGAGTGPRGDEAEDGGGGGGGGGGVAATAVQSRVLPAAGADAVADVGGGRSTFVLQTSLCYDNGR
jgi:hypothetical protein